MFRNIFKFGWRNLTRNKRRTFFTIMAIAVGVLTLVFARSYIKGIMNTANEAMINTEIGHNLTAAAVQAHRPCPR